MGKIQEGRNYNCEKEDNKSQLVKSCRGEKLMECLRDIARLRGEAQRMDSSKRLCTSYQLPVPGGEALVGHNDGKEICVVDHIDQTKNYYSL
eukprot:scaffold8505_cov130-Cylindrotheca_fusiformis.AAC.12